ncbi:hypothetical protein TraAM80_08018 [Trypanosoma rangeli]|uniref:Uncharacterized protein n=1 Tax=Trypanosoma rangeli TaxID=5698 RepID=A0A3R7M5E0_TRYRA|nr:uncharacterized protein TraAM80_08018 [Trypanosoma rangeli]RNE99730.1 hypothetical protein TraAM80_08018 [Trypanosoma rangeli]|eukprot:RNE99730.1 hypothetical protein TraAM80_08018 [Trypanosoma rangeli]
MKQAQVGYKVQNLLNDLVQNPKREDEIASVSTSLAESQTEFVMRRRRSLLGEDKVTVYLLGMEGTVAPLPLISQVLQWQSDNLRPFVYSHFPGDAAVRKIIEKAAEGLPALRKALDEPQVDKDQVCTLFTNHIIGELETTKGSYPSYYTEFMELMMEDGFERELLHSNLFQDAAIEIREWGSPRQKKTFVAIWSLCPTVTAKMLLYHCSYDDLLPYVVECFDPRSVGSMLEPSTYLTIRRRLEKMLSYSTGDINIIFATDSSNGAVAANASGAVDATFISVRPFNNPLTLDTLSGIDVATFSSFHQLRGGGVSYPLLCAEARESESRQMTPNKEKATMFQRGIV